MRVPLSLLMLFAASTLGAARMGGASDVLSHSQDRPVIYAEPVPSKCYLDRSWENDNRSLFGVLKAECGGDLATCSGDTVEHSVPYGNWGVDSQIASRNDTDQFAGWKWEDGKRQWDSCTLAGDAPQTSIHGMKRYAFHRGLVAEEACSEVGLNGVVFTSQGNFMEIWELDWCDEDELVAKATYPNLNVVLSCSGDTCTGASAWANPTSVVPNIITAKIRLQMWAFTQ